MRASLEQADNNLRQRSRRLLQPDRNREPVSSHHAESRGRTSLLSASLNLMPFPRSKKNGPCSGRMSADVAAGMKERGAASYHDSHFGLLTAAPMGERRQIKKEEK